MSGIAEEPAFGRAHKQKDLRLGKYIVTQLLAGSRAPVSVALWDGQQVAGPANARCRILLRDPGVLRDLILVRDLLQLAEAYLAERVEVEGDLESLFTLAGHFETLSLPLANRLRLAGRAWRLPRSGTAAGAGRGAGPEPNSSSAIARHYDVGNDFYGLWLDAERVYSCAYFRDPDQSLEEAQRDKLEYICRKLRLRRGQHLLDIGCGWGALACWAARRHGAKVHGITLSEEQYHWARERVRTEGLEGQVRIELRDYRELEGSAVYDRIVSVGMFEHIGVANFPRYFETVHRLLRPGGLFLNHGITSEHGWRDTPLTRFMNRYIFPDGELARFGQVVQAMEQAGFEIADVESLRRHYALTLRHWVSRLEASQKAAAACADRRTWRLWRLYMAGCAHYFYEGSINVYQILGGRVHDTLELPLRRDDLYRASPVAAAG
ncbi:SAM-dependent methyltransferase [Thiohalobacter sp.]|uniref:SAM-dependent methyltransferase n=1 Tax=Thiohalobacter sp. TaxID=2025948 RepID=UPI00263407F9|nr:cyclopropane-fatty-acyl-phospholipid synthase family protein [Thiohalobacter sp.]